MLLRTMAVLSLVCLCGASPCRAALQDEANEADPLPTPRELYERVPLLPLEYTVESDQVIDSLTDPRERLRRIDVSFTSQIHHGVRMDHKVVIFTPADPSRNDAPERRGKVVVIGTGVGDARAIWDHAEPMATRTGYPTMLLDNPGHFDGANGEAEWVHHTSRVGKETQNPTDHNYFVLAIAYLRALDLFQEILGLDTVKAVIGGHSKRATSAYTAAAIDPDRIAGVVYMGNESVFERMDEDYRRPISPNRTSALVTCPVLYVGATNEDGYEMFAINHIQEKMIHPWTIEYQPNYHHSFESEKQFVDFRMWVAHVFDGRPITRISEPSHEITDKGLRMRVRLDAPNQIIQVNFWYAYCDDVPYWRDVMWWPAYGYKLENGVCEAYTDGKIPDAWLVEVRDTAMGYVGYVSSTPQKVTDAPTAVRPTRGWRSRNWEPNPPAETP